jgi:hypothetical protein
MFSSAVEKVAGLTKGRASSLRSSNFLPVEPNKLRYSASDALCFNLQGALIDELSVRPQMAAQVVKQSADTIAMRWNELLYGNLWIVAFPSQTKGSAHIDIRVMSTDEILVMVRGWLDTGGQQTYWPLNVSRVFREMLKRAEKHNITLPPVDDRAAWAEIRY